jgi:NAD(P)H-hydrate repair Nnr-like enzyme with NAD(P)H-hydrate dehydratase domain
MTNTTVLTAYILISLESQHHIGFELTSLFPEVTIHHVASDSEVERLIQNTDENCTVIVLSVGVIVYAIVRLFRI